MPRPPGRRARSMAVGCAVAALMAAMSVGGSAGTGVAAAQAAGCGGPVTQLTNPGFEDPPFGEDGGYFAFPAERVTGWHTTAPDQRIELWSHSYLGVTSAGGFQHAELNEDEPDVLYQDVPTVPGTRLVWRLEHRGRNGTDVMRVVAGPPGGPYAPQADLTDGTSWGTHDRDYLVPDGQTTTRFGFQALSSAGGDPAQGNFIDEIYFGTAPCLVIDKHATSATGEALDEQAVRTGDLITYRVAVRNDGGLPADVGELTDELPEGLSYQPGTLTVADAAGTRALTDAADGDGARIGSDGRTVHFLLGTAAGATSDSFPPGAQVAYTFTARVTAAAPGEITNVAAAAYSDPHARSAQRVESNPVTVDVVAGPSVPTTTTSPTPVTVSVGDEELAAGGAEVWRPSAIALATLAFGAALVVASRRLGRADGHR